MTTDDGKDIMYLILYSYDMIFVVVGKEEFARFFFHRKIPIIFKNVL